MNSTRTPRYSRRLWSNTCTNVLHRLCTTPLELTVFGPKFWLSLVARWRLTFLHINRIFYDMPLSCIYLIYRVHFTSPLKHAVHILIYVRLIQEVTVQINMNRIINQDFLSNNINQQKAYIRRVNLPYGLWPSHFMTPRSNNFTLKLVSNSHSVVTCKTVIATLYQHFAMLEHFNTLCV